MLHLARVQRIRGMEGQRALQVGLASSGAQAAPGARHSQAETEPETPDEAVVQKGVPQMAVQTRAAVMSAPGALAAQTAVPRAHTVQERIAGPVVLEEREPQAARPV